MAPKIVDKVEKEYNLVRAATEVFRRQGFAAATMDAIAAEAGVAKGTLYLYFDDKEDLFFAVFDAFFESILEKAEHAMADDMDAEARLRALYAVWASVLKNHGDYASLMLEFWAAGATGGSADHLSQVFRAVYGEHRAFVADIIRLGQENGQFDPALDAEALAAVTIGGIDGLWLQVWFDPDLDAKTILEAHLEGALQGWRLVSQS